MSLLSMIGAPALAVTLVAGSVAGASVAAADTTPSPGAAAAPRLTQVCSRVPVRLAKVERLQQRLHADAQTRGSIAFLEARIDRARTEGHDDLVTVLTDRLAVRKDLDAALPDILRHLQDAQAVCSEHTSGAASS